MFVATTALREFWDTQSRFVFLGDWCRLYSHSRDLGKLDYEVVPYPLDDKACFERGVSFCEAFYEKSLSVLGATLNELHGVSSSREYWRTLLGPWLNQFIQALYDRHLCIKAAQSQYGALETIGLAEESYFTPRDSDEFLASIHTDAYNLQLITQVCVFHGVRFRSRKVTTVRSEAILPANRVARIKIKIKKIVLAAFAWAAHCLVYLRRGQIWYFDSHLPFKIQLRLLLATRGKAVPVRFHDYAPEFGSLKLDLGLRGRLCSLASDLQDDEFGKLFVGTLASNFPWLYLEGYAGYLAQLKTLSSRSPRALVSSSNSVPYQFLSAQLKEKTGTRIANVQHGGSFGTIKYSPIEKHDQLVADEYWSWGWVEGVGGRATPMPAFLRTAGQSRNRLSKNSGEVLYCGNTYPRYGYRLWSNPSGPQWGQVIEWRHRWLKALVEEVRAEVLVRLYPYDHYRWEEKQRLKDLFPKTRFDDGQRSFQSALDRAKLFVTDTNHTTFLEALAVDKPTVLFWAPEFNGLRAAAAPYFSRLREVGVLHDSPEAAARKVNEVAIEPLTWWHQSDVKEAVDSFRRQFAYTAPNAAEIWADSLRRLAQTR